MKPQKPIYSFNALFLFTGVLWIASVLAVQAQERPSFASGQLTAPLDFDGVLNEKDWQNAPVLSSLKTTVPEEGGTPSQTTKVQVIANARTVVIGITCNDTDPDGIIRFSKLRDADISEEDHVKIVIDPFLDGQSGYIFAVNALAARYDALVSNRGESENEDWERTAVCWFKKLYKSSQ